jgi:hypothetical protein
VVDGGGGGRHGCEGFGGGGSENDKIRIKRRGF